ncbi:MAG TPA: hypothetical protein VIC84_10035 [Blastocatellia bacterium]|jgi:hypothetical protein
MAKKLIKLSIATVVIAGMVGSSFSTRAYPPFLRKAQKFGAKDCTFCHTQPTGGEGWNERGNWLIAEKERRKADAVDVEWLADYKEGAKKDGEDSEKKENKEGAKKDGEDSENKEGAKKVGEGAENKENKEEPKKKDKKDGEDSEKKENKEEPKKKEKPDGQ